MNDVMILLLVGIGVAVGLYFFLQRRNEPKRTVIIPGPSKKVWDSTVDNYARLGRAEMIDLWSRELIKNGGTYVPPTLGQGLSDLQVAEELATLKLGQRYRP